MVNAEPVSPPNLPRFFWPAALTLAAALALLLLVAPLAKMFSHASTNYNEGWNAYRQREASQGKPLYAAPPRLIGTNYPPVSFHLIGLASRITGNINQTGRWVSLLSLLLVALLCGEIVRRFTASAPLAAYAALSVVVWLAVFKDDRIGMNDPQLLGTVFSLLGLYAYIREPEKLGWLIISAAAFTISVFTKLNLLAFPAAVGLHLLLGGNWKRLAAWCGVVAAVSALLLGVTRWIDGPYFFANILMPRTRSDWLRIVTDYAILFQLPIALAAAWSFRNIGRMRERIMVLALIMAHATALAFAGGTGVDKNIFFDAIFGMAMVGALAFAEYAPSLAAGSKGRVFALAALLLAPSFGMLIEAPTALFNDRDALRSLRSRSRDFDSTVKLLRSRPGPALCEDMLVCFQAGKPDAYDAVVMKDMVVVGRLREDELDAMAESASFPTVQLLGRDFMRGEPLRFTTKFMTALFSRYRIEKQFGNWIVMVPKE